MNTEQYTGNYGKSATLVTGCDAGIKVTSYPNPVHNSLHVIVPSFTGKTQLSISDATGKLLRRSAIQNMSNIINTEQLAIGVYLLEIRIDNKVSCTKKFVKE